MKTTTFDPAQFLRRLAALDETLQANGFHAMSPWWKKEIARFIRALSASKRDGAATMRRWVVRAGRRSGKSSSFTRLAVAWAKWGPWSIPAGDVPIVSFVSVSRDEATSRLRTIADILSALGESFTERGDEIELTGKRRVVFRVFPATVRGTVGHTSILVIGDEVARWESRESLKNPASEVFGSLMPTLVSVELAFAIIGSSVWSEDDYHAQQVDAGNTAHQLVSSGCTWECNPSITEEETHALEPDLKTWSREYANIAGGTVSDAFDRVDLLACFNGAPRGELLGGFVATDASSLVGEDEFAWIAGRETTQRELVVLECGGWRGDEQRTVHLSQISDKLAAIAQRYGVGEIFGDQREAAGLTSDLAKRNIKFTSYDWTTTSKESAMQFLRRHARERKVFLPDHPVLRKELLSLKAKLMPSGKTRYETGGKDYASCLICLAHAIVDGRALGGPVDLRCGFAVSERGDLGGSYGSRGFMPRGGR